MKQELAEGKGAELKGGIKRNMYNEIKMADKGEAKRAYAKRLVSSHKLFILLLILFITLLVQTLAWAKNTDQVGEFFKTFAKLNYDTWGNSIVETQDGYLVVGGVFDKSDSSHWGKVIKIDKNGNKQWEKELGKKARNSVFEKATMSDDNKVVLVGWVNAILKPTYQGGSFSASSGWAIKLKTDGNVEWDRGLQIKEVLSSGDVKFNIKPVVLALDAKTTKKGNTIIVGSIRYGISDLPIFWKLDKKGNVLWSKRIERKQSILPTTLYYLQKNGVVVGGTSIDHDNGTLRAWIAKVDDSGNVLREKEVIGTGHVAITELRNGSLIVGRGANHTKQQYVWLSKLKNNWDVEWEKRIESSGLCSINGLWATSDNEIIAIGGTCDNESERIWAAVFSESGELKSIKKFLSVNKLKINQAIPVGDDGFIVVGSGIEQKVDGSAAWVFRAKF
ncbi:MAG: hypothetical protein ACOYU4_01635 [Thermodesulfobacteriota bacterium]